VADSCQVFDDSFDKFYRNNCEGKSSCVLKLRDFLHTKGRSECVYNFAKMYIQYSCGMDSQTTKDMQHFGLKVISLFMLMAAAMNLLVYYLQQMTSIQFKKWDVATVTTSDFSVELNITKAMWTEFKVQHAADRDAQPLKLD